MKTPILTIAAAAACLAISACGGADAPSGVRSHPRPGTDSTGTSHGGGGTVTPPPVASVTVDRVVLVSVDGLRGDAIAYMPFLSSLARDGVWTDTMHTVVPSVTLPGHLSMLSGRDVTQFGIVKNEFSNATGLTLIANGATMVASWVQASGRTAAAVVAPTLIPQAQRSAAQAFFGLDTLVTTELSDSRIMGEAINLLGAAAAPTLTFIHLPGADDTGHEQGWVVPGVRSAAGGDSLGTAYIAAVGRIDGEISRLWDAIGSDVLAGRTALIVTADHGGGHGAGCNGARAAYLEHCSADLGDAYIPFVLVTQHAAPKHLTAPVRITQVAPTIGKLLGLTVPAGVDSPIGIARR